MATLLYNLCFAGPALLLSDSAMGEVCLYAREGSIKGRAGLF